MVNLSSLQICPHHHTLTSFFSQFLGVLGLRRLEKKADIKTPNAKSQDMSYTKGIQCKLVNTQENFSHSFGPNLQTIILLSSIALGRKEKREKQI